MKNLYFKILFLAICISTLRAYPQKNHDIILVPGIRSYGSMMKIFNKSDDNYLKSGLGTFMGYVQPLYKKLFSIPAIGYDYFWTSRTKGINSLAAGFDLYLGLPIISLTGGFNARFFLDNDRPDKLKVFEPEYGVGIGFRIASLDLEVIYRQIGNNKMLMGVAMGIIPIFKKGQRK